MLYYSLEESLLFLEISSSKSDVTPNVRTRTYEYVPPPPIIEFVVLMLVTSPTNAYWHNKYHTISDDVESTFQFFIQHRPTPGPVKLGEID